MSNICEDLMKKEISIPIPKVHRISQNQLFVSIVVLILGAIITFFTSYFTSTENRLDRIETSVSSIQTDITNIKDSNNSTNNKIDKIDNKIDKLTDYLIEQNK